MSFESVESITSLLCTIVGLLICAFKYIESPKRWYKYLTVFFLANFFSEYYWAVYELVMHDYPDISMFMAYLGWNIGYLVLLVAVFFLRNRESRKYFHPVILLPFITNVPQFVLYISFGGVLNNLWEVGITTLTMVFCLQEIMYYATNREKFRSFPYFSTLILIYLIINYGMWTTSCFDWSSPVTNPYNYLSIAGSLICILLAHAAGRSFGTEESVMDTKSAIELRFQALVQAAVSLFTVGICAAGFFTAYGIKNSMSSGTGFFRSEDNLITVLFALSAILIVLFLVMFHVLTTRYHKIMEKVRKNFKGAHGQHYFAFIIIVTLVLMVFAVIYNGVVLYRTSVVSVYEDGDEEVKTTATELENYLTKAVATLRVTSDSVDLMETNDRPTQEIRWYLMDQTARQTSQFDENFTGLYAYINGEYLDGLGWVPPEGYDPTVREWYQAAVFADGEVVIVSPYLDVQTGSVVTTIARSISEGSNTAMNVVALDVIVNHIKDVTQAVEIAGKGYGMVVNSDGFIVAHKDDSYDGRNITDIYGQELLDIILSTGSGRTTAMVDDEKCTLFIAPVMNQWYAVILIRNSELFEDSYSGLAVNIMVSLITFCLISFFYYVGYKNEQIYGKKVEQMNIQVVKALATAIDAKDNYTNGHSSRVAEYSKMIAARSGYSKEQQNEIYMMGLLHDVGKIGVPDMVINKPTELTDEEQAMIRRHPIIGNEILESIKERPKLAIGARWHHERYDGKGYPDGLAGTDIPEEARIITVADAYDAMTSRRSYRDVLPQKKVRRELEMGIRTQFDPRFARIMIQILDEDKDYSLREKS